MKIKVPSIFIEFKKYSFADEDNKIFVGRDRSKRTLRKRLDPRLKTESKKDKSYKYINISDVPEFSYKGAYLVAGYRGMGKSTLVKEVIYEINGGKKSEEKLINRDIIDINVYLSQDSISDNEFLRQIFIELESRLNSIKRTYPNLIVPLATLGVLIFLFSFNSVVDFIDKLMPSIIGEESPNLSDFFKALKLSVIVTSITICIIRLFRWKAYTTKSKMLFQRVKEVKRRIFSSLEVNQSDFISNSLSIVGRGNNSNSENISSILGQNIDSTPYKQAFEKISTKELEFEIKEILRFYDEFRKSERITTGNIVFVIDELDKIEPEFILENQNTKGYAKSTTENRKEAISKLLSNLKSFIHTASAKFVFIGGADMYEASLADIADRESFYSSIFHEVIYIPTFFKDFNRKPDSLTQMTEEYFYKIINYSNKSDRSKLGDNDNSKHFYLKQFFLEVFKNNKLDSKDSKSSKDAEFVLYQIYRFIVYLTYRSNGSPKKLKEFLEYYMIETDKIYDSKVRRVINLTNGEPLKNKDNPEEKKEQHSESRFCIKLKTTQQHKLGILSSIFMPYMLKNEEYKKRYNDKLLYLSAFLLDHILKFHKSAFSWRELELMPDIIIGSKTPNLRETLKELIDYLSIRHIRETTNAMFQYKFRSGTTLELQYISKISDESAAAFNFTFDESHHLKAYYKRQLKHYVDLYQSNVGLTLNQSSTVHSISLINSTIADLNFYDEDYDEAIKFYSDAIQTMRDSKTNEDFSLTKHQEVLFTRNRLLLSLCLEKSSKYDSAYSILRSITLDQQERQGGNKKTIFSYSKWEDPYKRMQIFLRPHLALLSVIEKDRSDGITFSNLKRNIEEYTLVIGCRSLFPSQEFITPMKYEEIFKSSIKADYQRVHTLLADYYQSIGSILFFKNNFFTTLFEWGVDGVLGKFMRIKLDTNFISSTLLRNYLFDKTYEKRINDKPRRHYYPSISSLIYYIISLQHLILPYQENFGIKKDFYGDLMFFLIETLTNRKDSNHLPGKHKFFVALILSKLSDSLLCTINNFSLDIFKAGKRYEKWKMQFWNLEIEKHNHFFSIENVIYLNILSYRFFLLSGNDYDAFFSLKKCLHIIRTHFFAKNNGVYINKNKFEDIKKIADWLKVKCDELLNSNDFFSPVKEVEIYKSIYKDFDENSPLVWSTEKEELEIIYNTIGLNLKNVGYGFTSIDYLKRFEEHIPTIKNIFTRLQYLRYAANLLYFNLKDVNVKNIEIEEDNNEKLRFKNEKVNKLIDNVENIQYCYKNLIKIYNMQGQSYIMNHSYLAVAYNNLKTWTTIIKRLKRTLTSLREEQDATESKKMFLEKKLDDLNKWEFNDIGYLKRNVLYYYNKIIQLHSEGKEYKNFIKELYMLEDDFNDSLVHFCAALERSLINSGEVEKKIQNYLS